MYMTVDHAVFCIGPCLYCMGLFLVLFAASESSRKVHQETGVSLVKGIFSLRGVWILNSRIDAVT